MLRSMVIGVVSLLLFAFIQNDLFGSNENFVSADPLPKPANSQNFHQQQQKQQQQQQQQGLIYTEEEDDEILVRVRKSPDARPDPRGGRRGGSRGGFRIRVSRYSGNGGGGKLSTTSAILRIIFGILGGMFLLGLIIYFFCK